MKDNCQEFTIGQLADRTGVKLETIRYYEKISLLPEPPRTGGGFRMYNDAYVTRLRFIRRSRQLDFSIAEIADLLELVDRHDYSCDEIRAITLRQADSIRQKIRDLDRLERTLRSVASRCTGRSIPDCPVIDALLDPDGGGVLTLGR